MILQDLDNQTLKAVRLASTRFGRVGAEALFEHLRVASWPDLIYNSALRQIGPLVRSVRLEFRTRPFQVPSGDVPHTITSLVLEATAGHRLESMSLRINVNFFGYDPPARGEGLPNTLVTEEAGNRLTRAFLESKSLTSLNLIVQEDWNRRVPLGRLQLSLVCINQLERLSVWFMGPYAWSTPSGLLGTHPLPHLRHLSLKGVHASETQFLEALKRQPKLESVCLTEASLTDGSWSHFRQEMQRELGHVTLELHLRSYQRWPLYDPSFWENERGW